MLKIEKKEVEMFNFQLEGDGTVYSVPVLSSLPMAWIVRAKALDGGDDAEQIKFVSDLFTRYAPGALDSLTVEQFGYLFQAYAQAGNASLGE